MSPPFRASLIAVLCLTLNLTAKTQLTDYERDGDEQGEITRIEAKMRDIIEQGEKLKLGNTNPREIFVYCKTTLPKLKELFRDQLRYVSPELQLGFRRYYIENRQSLLK